MAGPFVDVTDGATPEPSLSISQSDVRLSKNGGPFAQLTNAIMTSHDENGCYPIPLSATDKDTFGFLKVVINKSGALIWSETYFVLPQPVFDTLEATGDFDFTQIAASIAAILEDTGTTLPSQLTAIASNLGVVGASVATKEGVRFGFARDNFRNTTDGTGLQSLTVPGLGTAKGAVISADGTITSVDEASPSGAIVNSLGATDGNNQAAISSRLGGSGSGSGHDGHVGWRDRVVNRTSSANNLTVARGNFESWVPDGIRIDSTVVGSTGFLLNTLLIAGKAADSRHVQVTEDQADEGFADAQVPGASIVPTCGMIFTTNDDHQGNTSHGGYGGWSVGFFSIDPDTGAVTMVGQSNQFRWFDEGNTEAFAQVSATSLPTIDPSEHTDQIDGEFTISFPNWPDASTIRLHTISRTDDAAAADFEIVLFATGSLRAQAGILTLPDTTGVQNLGSNDFAPAFSWKPQMLSVALNQMTSIDQFSDAGQAGAYGLGHAVNSTGVEAGQGCVSFASEHDVSASNNTTLNSSRLIDIYPHNGSESGRAQASLLQFIEGGAEVNIESAPSAPIVLPFLAVEFPPLAPALKNVTIEVPQ